MKRIATLLALVIAGIVALIPAEAATAPQQQLTEAQKQQVLASIRKELPQKMDDGMTWTALDLVDNGKALQMTFYVVPEQLGCGAAELKEAFVNQPESEIRKIFWSEDFEDIGKMLEVRNVKIVLKYPDGSRQTFLIPTTAK